MLGIRQSVVPVDRSVLDLARLRVCFVAGTLGQGGAERQLYYMAKMLRQRGCDVRILSLTRGEFWEAPLRELGVMVSWVGRSGSRLVRLLTIVNELRRRPADLVQSQHFFTNLYAIAAARALGVPSIGAIRNDAVSEVQEVGRFFGTLNLRVPPILAANSAAGLANAITLGASPSRLHLLPNVVDTDHFFPGPGRRPSDTVRLLAVGRFTEQKRFDRFVSILAEVRQRSRSDVRGIIVGASAQSSAYRVALETRARSCGLTSDALEFRSQAADMAPVYREADIFVLSSDWEGTPNVVLEAMACGLPVVASRVGGVPEIIQHGVSGFHFEPSNESGMAGAVCELVKAPHVREAVGRRARKYIEEHRSFERLSASVIGLYAAALSSERPLPLRYTATL